MAPGTNERIPVVRLSEAPMGPVSAVPLAYAASDPGLTIMRSSGFADTKLRPGDVIEVTILDPGEDGLSPGSAIAAACGECCKARKKMNVTLEECTQNGEASSPQDDGSNSNGGSGAGEGTPSNVPMS
ncbi:hypothetical protein [Rhizobium phaseoli]|uniref:hypothetical protein n=1 Tax=Rhizobium phaseoli TaxID=396 RepID=UPI001F1B878C|nr:hypothetical protein [Rhizobium phaseoli]